MRAFRHRAERRDRDRHRAGRVNGVAAEQRAIVFLRVLAEPACKSLQPVVAEPFGNASVSRKPAGFAPLAARSDRLTRSAFCAIASGGSSGKKCTPPTMASAVTTSAWPAGGVRTAASSVKPSAPGCRAIGLKYRAISRSSADLGQSSPPWRAWPRHHPAAASNSLARNCRASWSSTALTMPVSSRSTKALATSTYSDTTTRAGTSRLRSSS